MDFDVDAFRKKVLGRQSEILFDEYTYKCCKSVKKKIDD